MDGSGESASGYEFVSAKLRGRNFVGAYGVAEFGGRVARGFGGDDEGESQKENREKLRNYHLAK